MEEVFDFFKSCESFFIATVDDNEPRVRPFGIIEIFEGKLYIQTGKKKDVFKQIEKNNNVELCALMGGKWMRLTGRLIVDDRVEAKKYILDKNPVLRGMYNENDDNTAVLYFESGRAVLYSFTDEPKIITL